MNKKRVAPAEMEILRYVMDHEPTTAREVADAMMETKGFARSTTQTLMERLRSKSYLSRETVHGINQYRLSVPKTDLLKEIVSDFVESSLGGSVSPFVAYIAERGSLSADEVDRLTELLEKMEDKL